MATSARLGSAEAFNEGAGAGQYVKMSTDQVVERLARKAEAKDISGGLALLNEFVGAAGFLLARYELSNENVLENVIASDWPFDLVRKRGTELISAISRTTELEKCLAVLAPSFTLVAEDALLPKGSSQQICSLVFNAGRNRYCLMFICATDVIMNQHTIREAGLLVSYFASLLLTDEVKATREMELTEREIECLYWIAEGKTSDEMAMIIGISKNTINNYITSVMRKTSTRTRSEAIAYAVRHSLV